VVDLSENDEASKKTPAFQGNGGTKLSTTIDLRYDSENES
jgi:hypothetical protein